MSLESLARQIAQDATRPMTRKTRAFAASQGWPVDVARTLNVVLQEDKWWVRSEDERAADLEYGTGENRPTGVLRQLSNRPEILEPEIFSVAERRLRGVL